MNYSETLVPTTFEEKRKQVIIMIVLVFIPFVFAGVGYLLKSIDFFWAVFCWIGAGATLLLLVIPKTIRLIKDDFYKEKIICKGTIQEIHTIKMGYGASSSNVYELVLEKKTIKLSERDLLQTKLLDVPFPVQGEDVEIHTLPKSGDVIKLLVNRNNKWEVVALV